MWRRRSFLGFVAGSCHQALELPAQEPGRPSLDKSQVQRIFTGLERDDRRDLKGVRVTIDGEVIAEAYFNGGALAELHDIRSAGKSVTSLLAGIAIDRRLISSLDAPIVKLLGAPERTDKAGMTMRHVLTMRSGLAADDQDPSSPGNENRMDQSGDWVAFALGLPMKHPPGSVYTYCSVNAFLAGAVVEDASGRKLDDFAAEHLFRPLGIHSFLWRRGPRDRVSGQGNLSLTVPDLTRIGQMCLDGGRFNGRQVVSASWIKQSHSEIVPIAEVDPYADAYGYMWYTKTHLVDGRKTTVHFASGNGGNKIYVVPQYRMVAGIASSAYGRGYGQRRSQDILLQFLRAVRSRSAL